MSESRIWLRTPRFDLGLQIGALVGIAPPLLIYAAYDPGRASSLLPLVSLIAIPFLHVFGSFFFAFSSRNRSPSPPRRLAIQWAVWAAAVVALLAYAPRGLATFALLYGGWHILRQNFGFLRELAHRGGMAKDPTLRRLDLAACIAPAVALWLFITERGPWHFMGADVYHLTVPTWLLALAFAAVPATALLREHRLAGNRTCSSWEMPPRCSGPRSSSTTSPSSIRCPPRSTASSTSPISGSASAPTTPPSTPPACSCRWCPRSSCR